MIFYSNGIKISPPLGNIFVCAVVCFSLFSTQLFSTQLFAKAVEAEAVEADNSNTATSCPTPVSVESLIQAAPLEQNLPITIEANQVVAKDKNIIDFLGNVIIVREQQEMNAEMIQYIKDEETFFAQNNVKFTQPGLIIRGKEAKYYSKTKQGEVKYSQYDLLTRPAQGVAENLKFEPGLISLTETSYSACPANAEDWVIKADNMDLHTKEGYGEGENVAIYFKDVPIFYTPYMQFPIDDRRRSGFLLPEIAFSSQNGADLSAPYYWNIAPNMDATITPRILTKHGFMLGGEFRYLDENQTAEVYAEYLNDRDYDQVRPKEESALRGDDISKDRGALSVLYSRNLGNNWQTNINYNQVSDNYYLDDFGNNLKDRSVNHLLQEANVKYSNSYLSFNARVQAYQELREDTNTYSRLPQLQLKGYKNFNVSGLPVGAGFISEAVDFKKNWDYALDADEGQRYHLRPFVNMPITTEYGFIKPKLSFDLLQYQLDEVKNSNSDKSTNRNIPIFSLDSGLFFERDLNLFDTGLQQTLEPRLFYLYVPYEEQNQQPLFDTSANSFSFNQLFRENRFSGIDRLGDANQLSMAVTSRLFDDENGYERLRASIGEIFYFRDRKVHLNSTTVDEADISSAIAAEVASQFHTQWNTSLSMMYNPHDNEIDTSTFRLQYKADSYHIANFDYTLKNDGSRQENYEQLDISSYWKIAPNWRGLARWNYSLRDDFNLESMLGLEYDSCCYALRVAVSREKAYITDEVDNRIMIQMQFKGLASIGNISDKTLADDIKGFDSTMSEIK